MHSKYTLQKDHLIAWSIFLFPYDSLPFFKMGIYRPIYVVPLFIYFFFFILFKHKSRIIVVPVFILVTFAICYTMTVSTFCYTKSVSLNFVLILVSASICVVSYHDYFKKKLEVMSTSNLLHKLSIYFIWSSWIPILVGFYQVVTLFILHSQQKYSMLTDLFAYRTSNSAGRIQLVSGEPAWASVNLIFLIVFIYFFNRSKYRKIILVFYIILFVFTFSTLGFFLIILIALLYMVLFQKNIIRNAAILSVVCLAVYILFNHKKELLPEYTAVRIENLKKISLNPSVWEVLTSDNSSFLRLVNPFIGLLSLKETHFLGTGGENYMEVFPSLVNKYFPKAMKLTEVRGLIDGNSALTPRNLISRIVSEFGVFGIFGVVLLLFRFGIRAKKNIVNRYECSNGCAMFFLVFLAATVNFDSYIYYLFVFSFSFLMTVPFKLRNET